MDKHYSWKCNKLDEYHCPECDFTCRLRHSLDDHILKNHKNIKRRKNEVAYKEMNIGAN